MIDWEKIVTFFVGLILLLFIGYLFSEFAYSVIDEVQKAQERDRTIEYINESEDDALIVSVCEIETVGAIQAKVEAETEETTTEAETTVFEAEETSCETIVEETHEETVVKTEAEPVTESETESRSYTHYSVNGAVLDYHLQDYLREQLIGRGINDEYVYMVALCEIYQESRYNYNADNGYDKGICQFREKYFSDYARGAGLTEFDIFNPIDSIYVYAWLTAEHLNSTGLDIAGTLRLYYNSGDQALDNQYVSDVMQWFGTMQTIN